MLDRTRPEPQVVYRSLERFFIENLGTLLSFGRCFALGTLGLGEK